MNSLDRLGLAYASKDEGYLATKLGLNVPDLVQDRA
jgi:hypothetical protein